MNFQQSYLYWLAGVVLLIVAVMSWQDKANPRRLTTGLFWGVYGVLFLLGDWTYQLVGDKRMVNIAVDSRFIAVAVYTIGMALLTMVMGNAFAAFPIVTAGIGIPILVLQHGGNPAVMAAIGMFSGYCGTLMTPMAANFNIVPAALLELPDKNAVIKAQVPTGIVLLLVNVFLMYFLMFL